MEHEFLHTPQGSPVGSMVLTHGAGANCRTELLITVANAFCAAGVLVMRYDMEFRRRRPSGPPSPATGAADRAGLKDAAERMREKVSGPVYLAGHSYGGRQASMLAAEEEGLADGLLLLSYPLHPPDKPHQMRTVHFPALKTPSVFVMGTKDPFGTPDELHTAISVIPAPVKLIAIQGAGHDLKKGKLDWTEVRQALGLA